MEWVSTLPKEISVIWKIYCYFSLNGHFRNTLRHNYGYVKPLKPLTAFPTRASLRAVMVMLESPMRWHHHAIVGVYGQMTLRCIVRRPVMKSWTWLNQFMAELNSISKSDSHCTLVDQSTRPVFPKTAPGSLPTSFCSASSIRVTSGEHKTPALVSQGDSDIRQRLIFAIASRRPCGA
jgi:hypothetical protein